MGLFEQLTIHAKRAILYAREESKALRKDTLSTEHLLLGLLHDEDTLAIRALKLLGVDYQELNQEIKRQCSVGNAKPTKELVLMPSAKRVIDFASDEAKRLNNKFIGTEHLLLGLIRENKGLAKRMLHSRGVTLDLARQATAYLTESHANVWPPPIFRPESESPTLPKLPLQSKRVTLASIFNAFGGQRLRPKTIEEEPFDIPRLAEAVIRNANEKNSPMARITSQLDGTHIEYYVSVSFQDALTLPSDVFDALITQLEAMAEQEYAGFTVASESDDEYVITLEQSVSL